MSNTVSLTTIAIVFLLLCLAKPPDSRWIFVLALVAAAGIGGVFVSVANGIATGIDTIDTIVNNARVG